MTESPGITEAKDSEDVILFELAPDFVTAFCSDPALALLERLDRPQLCGSMSVQDLWPRMRGNLGMLPRNAGIADLMEFVTGESLCGSRPWTQNLASCAQALAIEHPRHTCSAWLRRHTIEWVVVGPEHFFHLSFFMRINGDDVTCRANCMNPKTCVSDGKTLNHLIRPHPRSGH